MLCYVFVLHDYQLEELLLPSGEIEALLEFSIHFLISHFVFTWRP